MKKNIVNYSHLESKRFGLNIYRGVIDGIDIKSLKKNVINNNIDILILRIPVEHKDEQHKFESLGFPYLHADTLVYYYASLNSLKINSLKNNLFFEIVNDSNMKILEEMVPAIFKGYKNHYFSNPYLDKDKILKGYVEWAASYSQNHFKDRVSWLVKKGNSYVGFATCSFANKKKSVKGCCMVFYLTFQESVFIRI